MHPPGRGAGGRRNVLKLEFLKGAPGNRGPVQSEVHEWPRILVWGKAPLPTTLWLERVWQTELSELPGLQREAGEWLGGRETCGRTGESGAGIVTFGD